MSEIKLGPPSVTTPEPLAAHVLAEATDASVCSLPDLAAIIDGAADALISVDENGLIVLFNEAAAQILACPAQQALGSPIAKFIPEGLRQAHQARVDRFVPLPQARAAATQAAEVWATRADGQQVLVEVAVSSSRVSHGNQQRTLSTAVLRDLTLRKALQADLQRVSQRYRTVVDQSPDAIWLEEGGQLQLANAACAAMLGAESVTELIGRQIADFLPDLPTLTLAGSGQLEHGQTTGPTFLDSKRFETTLHRLDGQTVEVELSVAAVPDHGGPATQGVMRDITQRKRNQAMLQTTQASLLESQQIARLGYYSLDVARMQWRLSASVQRLLGFGGSNEAASNGQAAAATEAGPDEGSALDTGPVQVLDFEGGLALVHPEDRPMLRQFFLSDMLKAHAPLDREYRIVRPDSQQLRWVHGRGRVHLDAQGQASHMFGTLQDITERKRSELALERSRLELRRLSSSLTQAREAERRHVARELHDELGQRLSALKLSIAALLNQAGVEDIRACDKARPLLTEVDDALAAVRRIAADLRPPMLDDLGLTAALDWLSSDWAQRTGLLISLQIGSEADVEEQPLDELLNESAATTVYRIVQEALTNISRHAQARHVHIGLQRTGSELLVWVEDDGVGLSPGDTEKRHSNGLAGIRERAHIMGGAARIRNRSEGGCRLEARLPLDRADSLHAEL